MSVGITSWSIFDSRRKCYNADRDCVSPCNAIAEHKCICEIHSRVVRHLRCLAACIN